MNTPRSSLISDSGSWVTSVSAAAFFKEFIWPKAFRCFRSPTDNEALTSGLWPMSSHGCCSTCTHCGRAFGSFVRRWCTRFLASGEMWFQGPWVVEIFAAFTALVSKSSFLVLPQGSLPLSIRYTMTPRLQTSAAIPLYSRTRSTSGATKGKVPQGLLHVAWLPKTKARSKSASFNVRSSDVSLMMKFSGFKSRWQMRGPMWRCSTTPNACVMEDTTFIKDSGRCLPLRLSRPASRW
mmetsp:Transcript_102727/g.321159  ORF Transcript_102727/g.321159 Transcript_102727/m.321159 type:complete len:237 (-) Transcript_102727:1030-1740(-)